MADTRIRSFIELVLKGQGGTQAQKEIRALEKRAKDLGVTLKRDTSKQLKALQTDAKKAGLALDKSSKSAAGFVRQLAGFVGLNQIRQFVQESIGLEARLERGFSAIGKQLQALGIDTQQQLPRVREFLKGWEGVSGVLEQEAQPAFQKFLGITKNVEGAMFAVKLASDLTNAGLGDMSTNSERLANLLQGEVTEAAKSLGLQLRDQNGQVKTQTELLDELVSLYGGFSSANQDAQSDIESLASTWNQLKQTIGEGFVPALKAVDLLLTGLINTFKTLGSVAGTFLDTVITGFSDFGRILTAALDFERIGRGYVDAITEQVTRAVKNQVDIRKAGSEAINDILKKDAETFEDTEEGKTAVYAIAQAKQTEIATRASLQRQVAITQAELAGLEQGSEERLQKELDLIEQKRVIAITAARGDREAEAEINELFDTQRRVKLEQDAQARLDRERQLEQEVLQGRINLLEQGSQDRLDAELELLARQREAAIETAAAIGADVQKVREVYDLARLEAIKTFNEQVAATELEDRLLAQQAETDARTAALEEELIGLEEHSLRKFEIEKELLTLRAEAELEAIQQRYERELELARAAGKDTTNLEKALAQQTTAIQTGLARDVVGIDKAEKEAKKGNAEALRGAIFATAGSIFGQSKAIAIAETVINTFQAVSKTLAEWGWPLGPIFAALIAAQGFAQVRNIQQTQPSGSGFDDPSHDSLAEMGGRKWAVDMLTFLGQGFGDTLREFASGGPVATQVVNTVSGESGAAVSSSASSEDLDTSPGAARSVDMRGSTIIGTRAGLRKLRRILNEADRQDQTRRVS